MTRAVLLALAILVSGCHEEPTIVIKFEPNDAALKPVDLAQRVDLSRGVDLASIKLDAKHVKEAKEPKHECKRSADCVLEPIDCCDCANGGRQQAVAKKELKKLEAARTTRCKNAMCTMMLSTDPTCGQQAECVNSVCVMVPKKK